MSAGRSLLDGKSVLAPDIVSRERLPPDSIPVGVLAETVFMLTGDGADPTGYDGVIDRALAESDFPHEPGPDGRPRGTTQKALDDAGVIIGRKKPALWRKINAPSAGTPPDRETIRKRTKDALEDAGLDEYQLETAERCRQIILAIRKGILPTGAATAEDRRSLSESHAGHMSDIERILSGEEDAALAEDISMELNTDMFYALVEQDVRELTAGGFVLSDPASGYSILVAPAVVPPFFIETRIEPGVVFLLKYDTESGSPNEPECWDVVSSINAGEEKIGLEDAARRLAETAAVHSRLGYVPSDPDEPLNPIPRGDDWVPASINVDAGMGRYGANRARGFAHSSGLGATFFRGPLSAKGVRPSWSIVHLPTGMRLVDGLPSADIARAAAGRFHNAGLPWPALSAAELTGLMRSEAGTNILAALRREIMGAGREAAAPAVRRREQFRAQDAAGGFGFGTAKPVAFSAGREPLFPNRMLGYQQALTAPEDSHNPSAMANIALANLRAGEKLHWRGETWTVRRTSPKASGPLLLQAESGAVKRVNPLAGGTRTKASDWDLLVRDVEGVILMASHARGGILLQPGETAADWWRTAPRIGNVMDALMRDPVFGIGPDGIFRVEDPPHPQAERTETPEPAAPGQGVLFSSTARRIEKGIEDVGEKIGGARKDVWREHTLAASDLAAYGDRELGDVVRKERVFPVPDYAALAAELDANIVVPPDAKARLPEQIRHVSMGAAVARTLKDVRDSIQAPVNGWTREQMTLYIEGCERVRAALAGTKRWGDVETILPRAFGEGIVVDNGRGGKAVNKDHAAWPLLQQLGPDFRQTARISHYDIARAAMKVLKTGWPARREAWQTRFEISAGSEMTVAEGYELDKDSGKKIARFSPMFQRAGWHSPGAFGTVEEARAYIRDNAAAFYLLHAKGGLSPARFETREAALEAAREGTKRTRKAFDLIRPQLKGVIRSGMPPTSRRDKNVDAENFAAEFGFRGVEFGNWTTDGDRRQSLDHAYDAMMDLSWVLGVPPKALSLDGRLGLAFGARGMGKAAAHYEPGRTVVNLTKTRGAGAVAHEFAHALDDYMGQLSGDRTKTGTKRQDIYASYRLDPKTSQVRPELREAWRNLLHAMFYRIETAEEAAEHDAQNARRRAQNFDSWILAGRRRIAQTRPDTVKADAPYDPAPFLERFDDGAARLKTDPGERIAVTRNGKYVRDSFAPLEEMNAAVKNADKAYWGRQGSGMDADTLKALVLYARPRNEPDSNSADDPRRFARPTGRRVRSHYHTNAAALDAGEKNGYWSAPHEMFARAFESWVQDKIEKKEGRSGYLVAGADNNAYIALGMKERPYPEGEERARLNVAFDCLAAALQLRESRLGPETAIYSAGKTRQEARAAGFMTVNEHESKFSARPDNPIVADLASIPHDMLEAMLAEGARVDADADTRTAIAAALRDSATLPPEARVRLSAGVRAFGRDGSHPEVPSRFRPHWMVDAALLRAQRDRLAEQNDPLLTGVVHLLDHMIDQAVGRVDPRAEIRFSERGNADGTLAVNAPDDAPGVPWRADAESKPEENRKGVAGWSAARLKAARAATAERLKQPFEGSTVAQAQARRGYTAGLLALDAELRKRGEGYSTPAGPRTGRGHGR